MSAPDKNNFVTTNCNHWLSICNASPLRWFTLRPADTPGPLRIIRFAHFALTNPATTDYIRASPARISLCKWWKPGLQRRVRDNRFCHWPIVQRFQMLPVELNTAWTPLRSDIYWIFRCAGLIRMKFFLCVVGMVMIIEGLPYFAFPEKMKFWIQKIAQTPDGSLRGFGVVLMVLGLVLVYFGRSWRRQVHSCRMTIVECRMNEFWPLKIIFSLFVNP